MSTSKSNHQSIDLIRQNIINSLFSPQSKGSAGQTGQSYISHCKTWEDANSGERKPRYILLSVGPSAQVFLHKSKRNSNGSFSIGKTWDVIDLRAVEIIDDSAFKLSLGSRSYTWMAEDPYERADFVNLLVRSFRQCSKGTLPTLIGLPSDDYSLSAYSIPGAPSSASSNTPTRNRQPPTPAAPTNRPQPSRPAVTPLLPPKSPSSSVHHTPGPSTPTRSESAFRTTSVEPHASPSRRPRPDSGAQRARTPVIEEDDSRRPPAGSPRAPKMPKMIKPKLSMPAVSAKAQDQVITSNSRLISSPLRSTQDRSEPPPPSQRVSLEKTNKNGPGNPRRRPSGRSSRASQQRDEERDPTDPSHSQTDQKGLTVPEQQADANVLEAHDVLANVEEMLEGFEWRMIGTGVGSEGVDLIEERLLNELKALELAEIHAIIENDDRVDVIGKYLDEGLAELDKMEAMLSLYRTQLNLVSEDVTHIEGQNRGFQVQISNQRSLLETVEELMQTVHIPSPVLDSLVQEPLDSQKGISNLEKSITSLYKAILSVQDLSHVAAASDDSVDKYTRDAKQFCKRVYEFLVVMFKYQADLVLNDKIKRGSKPSLKLPSHESMEKYLERYCGLTLFIKEIDEARYQQLCAAYFATSSELHKQEISELIATCRNMIRKPTEDEVDATFAAQSIISPTHAKPSATRKPLAMFDRKDKKDANAMGATETLTAGQALQAFSQALIEHLQREQNFVGDFLHIPSGLDNGSTTITFADYADLEGYFRRAALNHVQSSAGRNKFKDILSVMDLIFGFLPGEIKDWIELIVSRDSMQMVSVLAALDTLIKPAQDARTEFLVKTLEAQQRKSLSVFERNIKDQLKAIETTKLTVKKRKGVVGFIATFPDFVIRLERQLEVDGPSDDELPTRQLVNKVYGQIVQAMFEALQTMARSDEAEAAAGAGTGGGNQDDKDKDRLNYHTLIIENMHHFVTTVSKINAPSLGPSLEQAKEQYDQNLNLYIRLVLRRPLARFIDFFQGIEQLLRTTSASEIAMHSQYTKSSLKRVVGSFDKKDLRKAVEALSKRVHKHFADLVNPSAENGVVMTTVWSACEGELGKWVGEWASLIGKCYGAGAEGVEFGIEDVHGAFQKYKPEHSKS